MDVKLPELGEGVTEGELVKWLVKVGDTVKPDQPIAEIMTDKATVEVPSPSAGKVTKLNAKDGDTIKVGSVLISLEGGATATPSVAQTAPVQKTETPKEAPRAPSAPMRMPNPGAPPATRSASSTATGMDIHPPAAESRVLATPSTRRLAREMGVDINNLNGSGLAGRVTREDVAGSSGGVEAPGATKSTSIPKPAYVSHRGNLEERVAMKGVRRKIAEKMQMAKHIIPHFTLMDEVNVSELVKLRTDLKEKMAGKVKITYLPFVMKALISTARDFREFNASIDDAKSEIVYKNYFNIGFAADTPQGLLVPVIKDADQKSILQISEEIVQLSEKARAGKLSLEEMRDATVSITNIGSVGGTYATPIINHPEVAILGMYKISERPIIKNGQVTSAHIMNISITADHRLIDGAVAAKFLVAFVARLENPGLLMLDLA